MIFLGLSPGTGTTIKNSIFKSISNKLSDLDPKTQSIVVFLNGISHIKNILNLFSETLK